MKEKNFAFIDGQNLHLGLRSEKRQIDLQRFRVWLKDKFHVQEAYYFLWFITEEEQELYHSLQRAGFIVCFREHSSVLKGKKKWNVDVDIVFEVMKKLVEKEKLDKIILVSGDGDYIKLVDYLIKKDLFKKLIFPNCNHSSLYKKIRNTHYYYLEYAKDKLAYRKHKKYIKK